MEAGGDSSLTSVVDQGMGMHLAYLTREASYSLGCQSTSSCNGMTAMGALFNFPVAILMKQVILIVIM